MVGALVEWHVACVVVVACSWVVVVEARGYGGQSARVGPAVPVVEVMSRGIIYSCCWLDAVCVRW